MAYVESNGARIYWEEHGAGDPLLLISGIGYSLDMWYRILPPLSARYRTLVFDNRGVGRSDVPEGPYLVPQMAADAVAVLDAAGVERAHVFGISLGSLYAQELGLSHPDRVRSLILASSMASGPSFVLAEPALYETEARRRTLPKEEGVEVMIPFTYDAGTPRERIEEDLAVRLKHYPTAEGYNAQLGWIGTFESESRLSGISAPTLVLHGESDRFVVPANATILAGLIPGARLQMIPAAGHLLFTDQPELVLDAITGFIDAIPAGADA